MKLFHYYNTYQKHDKNLFYQSPGLFLNMSVFYNYPQWSVENEDLNLFFVLPFLNLYQPNFHQV